jgi:hypothetical protein
VNLDIKVVFAALLIALTAGVYAGKTYFPATKVVETEREVVRKDVVTRTVEVIKPDGTRSTETTTTDKSKEQHDATRVVVIDKPNWHASASVSRESLTGNNIYGITLERRIFGPFSAGITANTQQTIGLVVGMEF